MLMKLEKCEWEVGEPLLADPGGFGTVRRTSGAMCEDAVAKFIPKQPGASRELLIGVDLRELDESFVMPVLDVGEWDDSFVIVMPRAEMSLQQRLTEPMELEEYISALTQIAASLAEVSSHVVHRDLKPANVLLWDGRWRLADFGIARFADASTATETRKFSFTMPFAAPEQWRSEHASSATDVYAFGVMAYLLVAGHLPFEGPDITDYRTQHLSETPLPLTAGTPRLRSIISECLAKAPEARPTAANIVSRLEKATVEPMLPGSQLLADVNRRMVERRFEAESKAEATRSEAQRRQRLFESAAAIFTSVAQPLLETIEDEAPVAHADRAAGGGAMVFVAELGGAKFGISRPEQVDQWQGPFDVVAAAVAAVNMETSDQFGWKGRSHSLWFCDARTAGEYAWFEMSFMDSPLRPSRHSVEPYSLSPGEGSAAFSGVIGTIQLAWPVSEIDRDDPGEFIDRWIGWFAAAADGKLARPSTMPERDPSGSWRRH